MITIRTHDNSKQEQFESVDKASVEAVFGVSGAYLKNNAETAVVAWNGLQDGQIYVVFGNVSSGSKRAHDLDEVSSSRSHTPPTLLLDFWTALGSAQDNTNHLVLPNNAHWLGQSANSDKLFVRDCYRDLWKIITDLKQGIGAPEPIWRIALSGNPGIGKTCFLAYVLYQLKKIGATIILDVKAWDFCVCFAGTEVTVGQRRDYDHLLGDPKTWYLVDGQQPVQRDAFTLLASSPRPSNYKEFLKFPRAARRWMPVWSLAELETCRSICFSNTLTTAELSILYDKWGGIPRYVLEKAKYADAQNSLEHAISSADLPKVTHSIGELDGPEDVSHKLIHIVVDPDYITHHIAFASVSVSQEVAMKFEKKQQAELRNFLSSSEGLGVLGPLRGTLFEGYAHNLLQRGGTFDVKNLSTGAFSTITLPPTQQKLLGSAADIASLNGTEYGRPIAKNFASVDSVMLPNKLFQMTVGASHPIKAKGYKNVIAHMQAQAFELYFAIPPDIFNAFTTQPFHTSKKKVTKQPPKNVTQYAIKIPLSS